MARVLLLLPTTTYRAEDFLTAALSLGVDVVVGADRKHVSIDPRHPERALVLDFDRPEEARARVVAFHQRWPLAAIIPVDDRTAVLAAMASLALGLPHNPPAATWAAANKALLREMLLASGVRTPLAKVFPKEADPGALLDEVSFPCVLKPLLLSASRGVIRADDPDSFCAAFARIGRLLDEPEVARRGEGSRLILVEPFVPGVEVALEGLLSEGALRTLAIFDKPDPLDGPFFEETLYVTPSRLPGELQEALQESVAAGAAALGLREGPVHAELRIDSKGEPWIIELAARSIGGLCARALRFGTGMSLEELLLRHATGAPVELTRERAAAGVMMLPIPREGVLRKVEGKEEALAVPGIEDLVISRPLGQRVVPLPEGASYLGFLFARGERPEEVERALRQGLSRLRFHIES